MTCQESNWKPTVPRGPIAAMYASPGPQYRLPGLVGVADHDPRSPHTKYPAYSFGMRHGKWRDDCGPGPAYKPEPKLYRTGKDGAPHYSLYGRQRDLTQAKTPGPGAYRPESSGPTSAPRAPQYSFGSRHQHRGTDRNPAPNAYNLPAQLGKTCEAGKRQAPIYSLTGRSKIGSFHEDLQKTPGPGNYSVTHPSKTKRMPPSYSLTGRNQLPGDTTTKPGPGAHSPERVNLCGSRGQCHTFGIRHSPFVTNLIVDVQD